MPRRLRRRTLLPWITCAWLVAMAPAPALAVVFPVNSTGDRPDANLADGVCDTGFTVVFGMFGVDECTLRAAIEQANATAGADQITFFSGITLGGLGVATIAPPSALPLITDELSIDGTTHSAYDSGDPFAQPVIYLDGVLETGNTALEFFNGSSGSSVHGMGIIRFDDAIVGHAAVDDLLIEGCWTGILNGLPSAGNIRGIVVAGDDAIVGKQCSGSSCSGRGNVVSGNTLLGLAMTGDGALIAGNRIGTDGAGTVAVPNATWGISIDGSFNQMGFPLPGPVPGEGGNVVSGNGTNGIQLAGADNRVEGNIVGLDATGTQAVPNDVGIDVAGLRQRIGVASAGSENVFAGNTSDQVRSNGATLAIFDGNYIGLGPGGAQVFVNAGNFDGIVLDNADQNTVRGNHVGGVRRGIEVTGGQLNTLDGNWVGVGPAGQDRQISEIGIHLVSSSRNNLGSPGMAPNVIGHTNIGIGLELSDDNRIRSNHVGRIPSGTSAFVDYGVSLLLSRNNVVGAENGMPGDAMGSSENRIAATIAGVLVDTNSWRNPIRGNRIELLGGLSVDLNASGFVLPNDPLDLDIGGNETMNFPEIDPVSVSWNATAGTLDLTYRVDSPYALQPLVVDFYAEDTQTSESTWFATEILTGDDVDEFGSVSITPAPGVVVNGRRIYATTTDGSGVGNTSFYSPPIPVPEPRTALALLTGAGWIGYCGRRRGIARA